MRSRCLSFLCFFSFFSFLSFFGLMPARACISRKRRGLDMSASYAAFSCCLIANKGSSRILEAVSRAVFAYWVAIKLLCAAPS